MARYTVEAGRGIVRDGVRILTVQREESLSPTNADALTHRICSLLNAEEEETAADAEKAARRINARRKAPESRF
jgi:hypothetical protein